MDKTYEELKRAGYSEREINDILKKMDAFENSVKVSEDPLGPGRKDKRIDVRSDETEKRSSNIMMGYNDKGYMLANGQFVNKEELESALNNYMNENRENIVVVSKKTGKVYSDSSIEKVFKDCILESNRLFLGDGSDKIKNQNTASFGVQKDNSENFHKQGILMLGKGFNLPNGEYVNYEELKKALENYVLLEKDVNDKGLIKEELKKEALEDLKQVKEEKRNEDENRIARIKKRRKIIAGITAAMVGAGMLGYIIKDKLSETGLYYNATQKVEDEIPYNLDKSINLRTGEEVNVSDGTPYYENSRDSGSGASDVFSSDNSNDRVPGNYTLDYISVLHNGEIVATEFEQGVNVLDFVQSVSDSIGIPFDDLKVMVHIGGPVSGWSNIENVTAIDNNVVSIADKNFQGEIEDFKGDSVTLENGAVIKIVDNNGNLLETGTTVLGSDGKEYVINSLSFDEGLRGKIKFIISDLLQVEKLQEVTEKIIKNMAFQVSQNSENVENHVR